MLARTESVRLVSSSIVLIETGNHPAHKGAASELGHRSCVCGAVYRRTEHMAASREIASFECGVCGATPESWNTAWVPRYRLVAGPVRMPERDPATD
jgi:hypothetical protein